jgi:hypothetical protein
LAGPAGAGQSYALLADGTTMTIRPAAPEDYGPVRRLHEAMSPDNLLRTGRDHRSIGRVRRERRVVRHLRDAADRPRPARATRAADARGQARPAGRHHLGAAVREKTRPSGVLSWELSSSSPSPPWTTSRWFSSCGGHCTGRRPCGRPGPDGDRAVGGCGLRWAGGGRRRQYRRLRGHRHPGPGTGAGAHAGT